MNQFFDFNRFSLLVAKHWADNKKRYILSVIAFMGLLIAWFVFTILTDLSDPMGKDVQFLTFFFSLFLVGTFYASQYYRDLGSRPKGINFLLVPASAFEKILCSLLYTVVLFFIVFIAAFYAVDILMVTLVKTFSESSEQNSTRGLINMFEQFTIRFDGESSLNMMMVFFSVQSAFLLGSVYFEKYSFLKTVISGFVIFFIVFCLVYGLYELMPDGEYDGGFLTSFRVDIKGQDDHLVTIPHWLGQVLYYLLMYAIAPFLWIVTWYRLKEKQV